MIKLTQDLLNVACSSSTLESFRIKSKIKPLTVLDSDSESECSWATVIETDEKEGYIGELISKYDKLKHQQNFSTPTRSYQRSRLA